MLIILISITAGALFTYMLFNTILRQENHSHPIINIHYKKIKSNYGTTIGI